MGALFGSLSALMIGFTDLFVRKASSGSSSSPSNSVLVQCTAIVASLLSVAAFGGTFTTRDLALGLASGAGLGIGFGTYYGGITRSSSTIVAPLTAAISAIIPFLYTLVKGASPSVAAVAGAVVAIAGVTVMTIGGGQTTHVRAGLLWGTASGIAYGVGFALVIEASSDAGSWPAVWQRTGAAAVLGVVSLRAGSGLVPDRAVRATCVIAGGCAGLCTIFYLIGVRADATVGVITASMFPAASVGIGRLFFRDTVSKLQAIGLVVVLVGVVGVVAG